MHCGKLAKVSTFKLGETVKFDLQIVSDQNNFCGVLVELEGAEDVACLNLMLQNN